MFAGRTGEANDAAAQSFLAAERLKDRKETPIPDETRKRMDESKNIPKVSKSAV